MAKITYVDVATVCNQLTLKGEKTTVRKITKEIGGSFTLISEYLNKWREEQRMLQDSDLELSLEVKKAMLAEFASIAKKVESEFKESLEEKSSDLVETRDELIKSLGEIKALNSTIGELQKTIGEERMRFEKHLSGLEAKVEYLSDEKKALHEKLGEANRHAHEAELKEAVALTKVQELEKQILNKTK